MLFQQIQQDHRYPLNSSSGHMVNLWTHLAPLGITRKTFGRHPGQLWGIFWTTSESLKDYWWSVPLRCEQHEHIYGHFLTTTKWHTRVIGNMHNCGSRSMEWRISIKIGPAPNAIRTPDAKPDGQKQTQCLVEMILIWFVTELQLDGIIRRTDASHI